MFRRSSLRAFFALLAALIASCFGQELQVLLHTPSLEDYIRRESGIALRGIFDNIGPHGRKSGPLGAAPGVVIASPQTQSPDYVYTWTRDSALVMKALIEREMAGLESGGIDQFLAYATSQAALQKLENPSGLPLSTGLGEPKFHVNISTFYGSWGRPQRDGPALRATALIQLAYLILSREDNRLSYVYSTLWPIVEADLEFVKDTWDEPGFDLWEETLDSRSFFTLAMQHRSLREGERLARQLGKYERASFYKAHAENILCTMQSSWSEERGYIMGNMQGGRTGLDANTVLASIHTYDPTAGCSDVLFQPCSERALANLHHYVNAFRGLYAINARVPPRRAVAVGRYPEDVYSGGDKLEGNPWYLATLAVAEQLFLAVNSYNALGEIRITRVSLPFWKNVLPDIRPGRYVSGDPEFAWLVDGVGALADDFLRVVQTHTPQNGSLAEQFSRHNGTPTSAADLTWSYAAAIRAFDARQGTVPPSWGASGLRCVPPSSRVTLGVLAETRWGEHIAILGSGNDMRDGVTMKTSKETYPLWTVSLSLRPGVAYRYHFARMRHQQVVEREEYPERVLVTPMNGTLAEFETWQGSKHQD